MNMQKLALLSLGILHSAMIAQSDLHSHLLEQRFSGYAYDSSRIISFDQLKTIVSAGRLAPSSYNDQPWYFIVCDRMTNPDAYNKVFSTLVEFNQEWVQNVPVLIISVAAMNSRNNELNKYAQYDTGAAAFSMMLQATALGLMAHQMGGFDAAKISELFQLPADFVPMAVMAIGYPAKTGETKSIKKERKSLNENFFMGQWGSTADNVWHE
jgi:nitroreductase